MTIPAAPQRGHFDKIYIDTDDDYETPELVELDHAEDGQWQLQPLTESLMLKKHNGVQRDIPYGVSISASFNLKALPIGYLTSVAAYAKLRNASLNGTPVHLQLTDGDITSAGKEVLRAWWTVSFTRTSNSGGHVDIAVSLTPADSPADEAPEITVTTE